ncbi:hypothetical protein DY000_02020953 [Brassica cretica]|uniref:Reverse transcriptase domain-containing protein n=1 Tax=Brassica cretica TaxID=69181 RepID=A0ABQ7EIS2_BRACR|nr:hypothetical protein DY000_02020953 [Brassica cretica]
MFSTQLRSSSKKNQIKRSSYVTVMLFTNQVIFSSRKFRPPKKLEKANLLSDEPTTNSIMPKVKMFGLHKKSGQEKFQRQANYHSSSQNLLNVFDDFVPVQERLTQRKPHEMPNRRCKEQFKMFRDEVVQRRLFSQFEIQEFCDNLVEGVVKALKDVSKNHKKSTTTCAPVAEPSLFINEKPKGKFENNLEDLKDFSDFLPIFDEYNEELLESLIIYEDECDLPSAKSDFMFDDEETNGLTGFEPEHPSSVVLVSQDFEEEQFNYPQQGPLLDTRRPMDDDLGPIFDEENELGPILEEKAPSITSINMENHLCFDPGTTHAPLSPNPLEHCKELGIICYAPDLFVKVSSSDRKCFGLEKVKEFCVSNSVFDNMIHSFKKLEPDKLFDQKCVQDDNDIPFGLVLSFDQFLKHSKCFDHLEKSFELVLQQLDLCFRKPCDSFVCFKDNGFDLSFPSHELITDDLFSPTRAWKELMFSNLQKTKSLRAKTDFCCDFVLKPAHSYSESDLELLNSAITCPDTILVYNTYFDGLHDDLKRVLHVLGKETLVSDLNKYMSCTYDPGKMDLRSNPFQEGGNDAPLGSAPGKTDMHDLIMGNSKDICSLFDSYLQNHEYSTHEITWRMFSTQLRSSSKKNQIKRSSYVTVMPFTNQVIFNSREFRPPEKLEMANLLSDEPTTNSIMPKVIIHVLNVQESLGLDGFQKDSKTDLFGPNGETDKILAKGKDGFRPGLKGTCLGPYQKHILHFSKSWS